MLRDNFSEAELTAFLAFTNVYSHNTRTFGILISLHCVMCCYLFFCILFQGYNSDKYQSAYIILGFIKYCVMLKCS